ncbi:MAG: hypothetical protein KY455_05050 [Euryarchaeota archaeon]|nr:hypothetical protein [Euryarchaeota archaeon]
MIDDILGQIVKDVRRAVEEGVYSRFAEANTAPAGKAPSLVEAVRGAAPEAFLAEVKPSSPSAGVLADGEPLTVGRRMLHLYRAYGATGISVLTERDRFGGSLELLAHAARAEPRPPVLMKDFLLSDSQLDAASSAGASAVLYIHHLFARGHTSWELPDAIAAAHDRGLEVLLEVDGHQSLEHALGTEADILGINNRDLRTLEMDLERTPDLLRHRIERLGDRPVLALSGITTRDDVVLMRRGGAAGVLVGSSLMSAADPRARLRDLRGITHVKVCGAGHPEDPPDVFAAMSGADAVGCVVAAGGARRERSVEEARLLFSRLPQDQEHVLVTTDTDPSPSAERVAASGANMLQLHAEPGAEGVAAVHAALPAGVGLIALVRVPGDLETPDESGRVPDGFRSFVEEARAVGRHADRLLLDVAPKRGEDAGGTGRTLPRHLARHLVASLAPLRVVIAGGLAPGNIAPTLRAVRPWGIDLSSGAEGSKTVGRKDAARVRDVLAEARSIPGLFDAHETGRATGAPVVSNVQWKDRRFPSSS